MSSKKEGINAERELIHMFWKKDWAAIRVAGSGSSRYPSPDILAGNNLRKLAIECKSVSGINKYLASEAISQLKIFSKRFGAEPWIGIRFDNLGWFLLSLEDIIKVGKSFKISKKIAEERGLLFSELIS